MRDIIKRKINIDKNKRIIAVSDIHGGVNLFKELLANVSFCDDDYLFILGDMINRGKNSLETIRFVMELSKKKNVFVIKGNHEEDLYNRNILQKDKIKYYVGIDTSILHEMIDVDYSLWSEDQIYDYAFEKYEDVFTFIFNLPDLIETDDYIFVHSAYFDENTIDTVLRTANYKKYNYISNKWIIVGHYPTANYPTKCFNCNPIVLEDNKIIFIDGGKGVKAFGQLNAFIINDGFSYISTDDFEKVEVICDQKESGDVSITYLDPYVEVIEESSELLKCIFKGKEIFLEKRLVYNDNGRYNARNASNYFLELKKGDIVSLVYKNETISQIKKEGIVGYAYNKNLGV